MEHFFKALRTGRICLAPFNKACLVVRNSYQHLIGDVLSEDGTESSYWTLQLAHILPFLRLSSRAVQRWQNLQSKHTVSLRTNMYEVTYLSGETKGTVLGIQRAEKRGFSLWLVLCCWNPITFSCFFSSYVFLFNFLQPLTVSGVGKTFPPFPLLSLFLPIPSFLLLPPLPRICCSFPFELPYGCPFKIALL